MGLTANRKFAVISQLSINLLHGSLSFKQHYTTGTKNPSRDARIFLVRGIGGTMLGMIFDYKIVINIHFKPILYYKLVLESYDKMSYN